MYERCERVAGYQYRRKTRICFDTQKSALRRMCLRVRQSDCIGLCLSVFLSFPIHSHAHAHAQT